VSQKYVPQFQTASRSRRAGCWACQNEAPVSPWPTGALALRSGRESFCYVLTSPCPKGARSSAEAKGWMRCAAFRADFAPLQRGHRSPSRLHVELFQVIFETRYSFPSGNFRFRMEVIRGGEKGTRKRVPPLPPFPSSFFPLLLHPFQP
jgi:hypothetical protein